MYTLLSTRNVFDLYAINKLFEWMRPNEVGKLLSLLMKLTNLNSYQAARVSVLRSYKNTYIIV